MEIIQLKSIGAITSFYRILALTKIWSFDTETTILHELKRHDWLHPDKFKVLAPYIATLLEKKKNRKKEPIEVEEMTKTARRKDLLKGDTRLHPKKVKLFSISFYIPDKVYYIEVQDFNKNMKGLIRELQRIFALPSIKLAHRLIFDAPVMSNFGVTVQAPAWCTKTMACVHDENDVEWGGDQIIRRYGLKFLVKKYLGVKDADATKVKNTDISELSPEDRRKYCGDDSKWAYQLAQGFYRHMKDEDLLRVWKVETDAALLFAEISSTGLRVDKEYLINSLTFLENKQKVLEKEIYKLAKKEFNIGSNNQVAEVLFDDLGLKRGRETKKGWSVDKDTLEPLKKDHPIVEKILLMRSMNKTKGTYILPFLQKTVNGRLFPALQPWGARTGRTSSKDPNFGNLPQVGDDWTQVPKKCILPDDDESGFISADQSQVEYRFLGHFSRDPKILRAYKNDPETDFHMMVAKDLFEAEWDSLTEKQQNELRKKKGKKVNFATVYGQGEEALAIELGFYLPDGKPDKGKAKAFQDQYFIKYPGIQILQQSTWRELEEKGFVRGYWGRKRRLPEIDSRKWGARDHAKRQAFNFKIQNSASGDLLKVSMVLVDRHLKKNYPGKARIVMTVYDELLISCKLDIREKVAGEVKHIMENCVKLDVPLIVDIELKERWAA